MIGAEGFSLPQALVGVLDELDETVFLLDVERGRTLRVAAVSGRRARWTFGTKHDVRGKRIEEFLDPAALERVQSWAARALDRGEAQRYRSSSPAPGGLAHDVEVTLVPWNGGAQLIGIARLETGDREELQRIRRRDELNRAVLDTIPASTAVVDPDGIVRLVNASWVFDAADPGLSVALPGEDFLASVASLEGASDACRKLLAGELDLFETDYLERDRWFNLRVVPLITGAEDGAVATRTDVTERVQARLALQQLHDRWEAAFASAAVGMALIDRTGRFVLVNPRLCSFFGRSAEELLQTRLGELSHPDDAPVRPHAAHLALEEAGHGPGQLGIEKRYIGRNGEELWGWVTWSRVEAPDGAPADYFVQIQDVRPRKRAEARLEDQRELLELVAAGAELEAVLEKVAVVGERHLAGSRWVVLAAGNMGWSEHVTAVGLDEAHALELDEIYRTYAPATWREKPGVIVIAPDGGTPVGASLGLGGAWTLPVVEDGGQVTGFVVVHDPPAEARAEDTALVEQLGSVVRIVLQRDASARRFAERLLEDSLTGLPSRTLFHRRAEQALARAAGTDRGVAVLNLDLDRFGRINESLGHAAGDQVLRELARRLRRAVSAPDTVARGGGDEFLVLVEDVADEHAAMAVAHRLLGELRRPLQIGDVEFSSSASIGVAFRLDPGVGVETWEADAALATAAAKAHGRDRAELFTEQLRVSMPRLTLDRELQQAVALGQFVVHFQPEVALESNRIVGAEALVRWEHPERGLLPPAEFIGAAEESGLIVDIGRQVLAEACARLAEWSELTDEPLTIAVNLSARQLGDPNLVDFIRATLARHGIAPQRLVLEMTESTLVDDTERVTEVFQALRDMGIGVAIDDFGTGYSSLLYLKRFPADMLKIDRSFVDGLGEDAGDSAIVAAVIRLAHRLDLTVIAEGVETAEQLAHLRRLGCEQGQGYFWSRPRSADDLAAMLRRPLPEVYVPAIGSLDPVVGERDQRDELDELLAVLTHELSTPLTVIGGYTEMLATRLEGAGGSDEGTRSEVAAIERNVLNLGRLVSALADARGLGGPGRIEEFDAVEVVAAAIDDLTPILTAHRLTLDLPSAAVPMSADPSGLSQILTNLVGNAAKFTNVGERIDVRVRPTDGNLQIVVADHGPGIDPRRAHELFGRFSRLGSTQRGLGLGLYLSQSIARRHGGDIRHEPTPGGGATFVVTMPLVAGGA